MSKSYDLYKKDASLRKVGIEMSLLSICLCYIKAICLPAHVPAPCCAGVSPVSMNNIALGTPSYVTKYEGASLHIRNVIHPKTWGEICK